MPASGCPLPPCIRPRIRAVFHGAGSSWQQSRADHVDGGIRVLAQITSGAVLGVDAYLVHVEVDLAKGLPCM